MIELKTKSCRQFGQQEIVVCLDSQSKLDPKWLLDFLEKSVSEGRRYKPNETLQIGWMILLFKGNESGDLELWEPQFDSIPIKWTRGANTTLRHLILQQSVADLLKVEPHFPSLRQSGLASLSFLTAQGPLEWRMKRGRSFGNDSGWEFATSSFENQEAEHRSLFELSFHQTAIVPFLALPSDTCIVKMGTDIVIEFAGVSVNSKESPLLHKIAQTEIFV